MSPNLLIPRRTFKSKVSPDLLDHHLDQLTGVLNDLRQTVMGTPSNTGTAGGHSPGGSGSGGGNSSVSAGNPPGQTNPANTDIPPFTITNTAGITIPRGTILGFLSNNLLIPAIANNAHVVRGLIIADKDYFPTDRITPQVYGVHQALVDITNSTTNITPGDPCYLSWLVAGRTTNTLAPNPNKRLSLGFYLSTVQVVNGIPLAWIGFIPILQATTGV